MEVVEWMDGNGKGYGCGAWEKENCRQFPQRNKSPLWNKIRKDVNHRVVKQLAQLS